MVTVSADVADKFHFIVLTLWNSIIKFCKSTHDLVTQWGCPDKPWQKPWPCGVKQMPELADCFTPADITLIQRFCFDTPGGFDYNLKLVNFKLNSMINNLSIFYETAIKWMPQHLTAHWSTLVQAMAWCHQATSHYLSQSWPRSLSPYDVTRPQWVKWNGPLVSFSEKSVRSKMS